MSSAQLRILVPVDTPELDLPLVELASSIATPLQMNFHLIHVDGPNRRSNPTRKPVAANGRPYKKPTTLEPWPTSKRPRCNGGYRPIYRALVLQYDDCGVEGRH